MTPEQLESAREREFALYAAEVRIAKEPKLHILLVHLYIEHLLERLLATHLRNSKKLFGMNGLTFEKKALLAEALGSISAQRLDSVLKLNGLRNSCVHKFKYKPGENEVDEFARTLGKMYTTLKGRSEGDSVLLLFQACALLSGELLRITVDAENGEA